MALIVVLGFNVVGSLKNAVAGQEEWKVEEGEGWAGVEQGWVFQYINGVQVMMGM